MTDKESIYEVVKSINNSTLDANGNVNVICEDIILNDLEVLEILKKYIRAGHWSNEYTLLSWEMKAKELKKIKEWLENE